MKTAKEIIYSLPNRLKKEEVKKDFKTTFHFVISGDRGGEFTVNIKDGDCNVKDGLSGEPNCVIKTKDKTYEKLEYGKINPKTAFMFSKVKVSNINEMIGFVKNFKPVKD